MKNRTFQPIVVLVMLVATALAGCTMPVTPAPAAPPAASSGEVVSGELIVYTSRAESLFKPVLEAFSQANPDIKVTVLTGSNGELAAKLLEERANPQADVLINSDILTMQSLAEQGVFAANPSAAVAAVPETYRADDGSWVALTLRPRVIMYNTELVAPEEVPTTMMGLTDPQWKGQVGSADSRNGAMVAQLVAMRHLLDEETMSAFVRGLVANDTQWFGGHTDVRKAVGAGELKLGLVNHYYYHLSKAEGAPVGIVYPDQGEGEMGLVVNSTNAGIVQGSKHPALAQLFVDFMLSPEGQKVYAEQNFEYPVTPGVATAEGVPPLSDFKLADVTLKLLWDELQPTQQAAQAAGLP
ncbi:MAG: iron(III) ABC transporter iron (III)-binding protein [Chloroflexota bacterium]|nr:extracellular solute-binding protein [Caldilinea sp.]GIK75276.1 MAG: iron(III) ABC transporter iron (III)-binding protein [Chloroflexota bacterium]